MDAKIITMTASGQANGSYRSKGHFRQGHVDATECDLQIDLLDAESSGIWRNCEDVRYSRHVL